MRIAFAGAGWPLPFRRTIQLGFVVRNIYHNYVQRNSVARMPLHWVCQTMDIFCRIRASWRQRS
jgi:hypothetical protein